jgi:hypothetical protein
MGRIAIYRKTNYLVTKWSPATTVRQIQILFLFVHVVKNIFVALTVAPRNMIVHLSKSQIKPYPPRIITPSHQKSLILIKRQRLF